MVDTPCETPVTTPAIPTVATAVLLLLHTPPVVTSLSVVVLPAQTVGVPVIAAGVTGNEFTVTIFVADALPQPFVLV